MAAPIEHRAVLRHEEVMQAAMASRSRPVSVAWLLMLLVVGLIVALEAGHRTAFWFVQQLPFSVMFAIGTWLPTTIPALFAFVVVVLVGSIQNRAIHRSYLRNFTALGIPREIDALFEILPEGLRVSTERLTIFPRWQAIDMVERGKLGWVLSADQLTFLITHRSFSDDDAERAFIAALVAHLSSPARDRSPDAVALARAAPAEQQPTGPAAADRQSTAILSAAGQITAREISWAGRVGFDRIAHTDWHTLLYPMLAALTGAMLGMVVSGLLLVLLPLTLTLGNIMVFAAMAIVLPLVGGVVGLWLAHRRLGTVLYKAYHAALAQRGSPPAADCEWTIAQDGLVTRSARGHGTTRWDAISEVFLADAYWIVLADLSANVIPRRAFTDEAAERAFVGALLARLPQLARERSRVAAELAAS